MYVIFLLLTLLFSCGSDSDRVIHGTEPYLRVPSSEPESLDPRLIRTTYGITAATLIYDGLLRYDARGKLAPALAEGFEVSEDQKTYTFRLREAVWSNGDPVTAENFVESWISQLSPDTPSAMGYLLYPIKGAKAFKEGRLGRRHVGIRAVQDHILEVKLEKPTPYFPELVATFPYMPVHQTTLSGKGNPERPIGNGPFVVEEWRHNSSLKAARNELYWDRQEVKLDQVELVFVDDQTALNLFLSGGLDWAGGPNSNIPRDAFDTLTESGAIEASPAAGTTYFKLNTLREPLQNKNLRRALSLAIDREAIAEHLMRGKFTPVYGFVPPSMRAAPMQKPKELATDLFQQALNELGADRDSLPPLKICYNRTSERNVQIAQAVQQQWQNAFGIQVELEQCELGVYFDRLERGDYDIGFANWLADYRDPMAFLEIFISKHARPNRTGWEDPPYAALLEDSAQESDPEKRAKLLEQADQLLVQEAPIAPLFALNFIYAKHPRVHGVSVSPSGYFDFKYAFIDDLVP